MIGKVKRKITSKISNIIGAAVRKEMVELLPIIPQLIEFQNSAKEERQSFYDHTKDPLGSIDFYEGLKDRLLSAGVPVEPVDIDISDFERWLSDFPEVKKFYENMGDVFIEKCLEHYLTFRHLNISAGDVYIDVASCGSPWAEVLNSRTEDRGQKSEDRNQKTEDRGVRAYRLDLSYPKGINGIDIGADAGDTKLPDDFASVQSLQCAYECFMGDADILFVEEASRILNKKGRYGIAPLYLADIHFVSSSPYCNQAEVVIEPEARKVWRDDEYKVPFSRHYSPESFAERIYSRIPEDMDGKILYFKNLDEVMRHYPGQGIYCFFMFLCEKKPRN
jgi:hypothetical protein